MGFAVAEALAGRWGLSRPRERYRGRLREGRAGPGGPRIAVLEPQTYMNDAGRSVGPARGAYRLALERGLGVHAARRIEAHRTRRQPGAQVLAEVAGGAVVAGHHQGRTPGAKPIGDAVEQGGEQVGTQG